MKKELTFINADILGAGQSTWLIKELGIVLYKIYENSKETDEYEILYKVENKNIKAVIALLQTEGYDDIQKALQPLLININHDTTRD